VRLGDRVGGRDRLALRQPRRVSDQPLQLCGDRLRPLVDAVGQQVDGLARQARGFAVSRAASPLNRAAGPRRVLTAARTADLRAATDEAIDLLADRNRQGAQRRAQSWRG